MMDYQIMESGIVIYAGNENKVVMPIVKKLP